MTILQILEFLSICPYCDDNPCEPDCIMWHRQDEELTAKELDDRGRLELAREALEKIRKGQT